MRYLSLFPCRAIDRYADVLPDLPKRKQRAILGLSRPTHYVRIEGDGSRPKGPPRWARATPWRMPDELAPWPNAFGSERWIDWLAMESMRINACRPGSAQVRRLSGAKVSMWILGWQL